jgi:hypothetical protein
MVQTHFFDSKIKDILKISQFIAIGFNGPARQALKIAKQTLNCLFSVAYLGQ